MAGNKKRNPDGTFTSEGAREMGKKFGHEGGQARKKQIENDPNQSYSDMGRQGGSKSRRGK